MYGNRCLDPIVVRFTSIDRFTEDYHSLTPYQYGGNNPIKFIDVNGDSLWINYKDNKILYVDGNLYNSDGSSYSGKGVKVKKDGTVKYKGFLGQVKRALDLLSTTASGSSVVNQLQRSSNNFEISQKNNASNFVAGFGSFGNNIHLNEAQAMRVFEEGKLVLESLSFDKIGTGGTIWISLV